MLNEKVDDISLLFIGPNATYIHQLIDHPSLRILYFQFVPYYYFFSSSWFEVHQLPTCTTHTHTYIYTINK